ncbi:hypothetical protein C8R45DRAFT_933492 [Mycena sanguinolenta]|nr:hypothetical protein C8R45DRAFT_933492 [Mycena sanguinolenta]
MSATPSSPCAVESPVPADVDDSDSDFLTLSSLKWKKSDTDDVATADVTTADVMPGKQETKPAPAVSKPAPKKTPATKPATTKDKFAAAVTAEEETAQQALKVRQSKLSAQKEVEIQKLKVKGELKAKKEDAKLELTKLKMQQEHEYRMERLRMEGRAGPSTYDAHFDLLSFPSHSSDSSYGAVDSSNFDFDSFGSGFSHQSGSSTSSLGCLWSLELYARGLRPELFTIPNLERSRTCYQIRKFVAVHTTCIVVGEVPGWLLVGCSYPTCDLNGCTSQAMIGTGKA